MFNILNLKAMNTLKIKIGCNYTDYDEIFIPFVENLENLNLCLHDFSSTDEALEKLKELIEAGEYGFYGSAEVLELSSLHDNKETANCEELDLIIFKELAYMPNNVFSRPFDLNPEELLFSCYFAYKCYVGEVYSKDFAYYYCDGCNRYVCGQNPSNGWHSQIHVHDGWIECNKCYEERVLSEGINSDFDNNLPGQFFNDKDIEANGWQIINDHVKGSKQVIDTVAKLINSGRKVLINYERMAIGGLEGYVSVYIK
jgi:hypothetical protein